MEGIKEILKAHGIELEDGKLDEIEKATLKNYRTIAEFEGKTKKLADLEARLAEANKALEAAQAADPAKQAEYEAMQKQLADYQAAEDERKKESEASEARKAFEDRFTQAVGERKFANQIVRDAIFEKAFQLSSANPAMEVADVLKLTAGDADGIWANPQRDPKKMPGSSGAGGSHDTPLTSWDDIRALSQKETARRMDEINAFIKSQERG